MTRITLDTIRLAAHYQGNDQALDAIQLAIVDYLGEVPHTQIVSASKIMWVVLDSTAVPNFKQFSRALYNLRQRPSFAPMWRHGSRKTLGGNLCIEYVGQRP